MSKLPSISAREAIRAFESVGYERDRQRGSHIVLRHRDAPHVVSSFPSTSHSRRARSVPLIRESGLTVDEFNALL